MHAEGEKNPDDLHLRHYLARAKHILVVLPGMKYVELMRHPDVNTECDYVYHLMQDTGLNPASFMGFKLDGEAVVDYILSYARDFESKHPGTKIDGVMAFDCFPTMCASIVNHVLGLQGPSIPSLIMCDCKKEMRKHLTPHVKVYDPVEFYKEALSLEASGADPVEAAKKEGSPYPVVIKGASGQFYMASKTLFNYKEVLKYIRARPTQEGVFNPTSEVGQKLQSISCADAEKADLTSGNDIDETARSMIQYRRRQNFFYKYGGAVGKYDWGVSRPEDLPLFHVEEMFHTFSEQQIEIVVDKDGKMLIADTGDISRSAVVEEAVTVFKTPGSFKIEGALKTFAKDVTEKLIKSFGFKNGALDLEFVRIKDGQGNATEKYELIEYNARYSYMGWHQMEGTNMQSGNMRASAMHTSNAIQEVEAKKSKGKRSTVFEGNDLRRAFLTLNTHKSVRNLKNRTQLCLGLLPSIIPARDEVGESKLAVFAYTKRLGPEDEIIDMPTILQRVIDFDQDPKEMMAKLKAMKGRFAPLEEYVPKTLAVPKTITETDQAYQGYCKHGFFLMTWRDENEAINSALKELVGTFFRQQTDTYLDCVLAMPHSEHPNVEALSN
ncbi:unnamed protein product [Amoebophrya sp. A25]|nr:unnamed protein product [Amoebophrya sp. A25]|eukprot:GSA25T00004001001.1